LPESMDLEFDEFCGSRKCQQKRQPPTLLQSSKHLFAAV
jgi:hypothetical protein